VIPGGVGAEQKSRMTELTCDPSDEITPLEALLELPRSAGEDSLEDFLVTVGETICRTADFTTVVLNLYRPAWDDYAVALVLGEEASVEALTGTSTPRSAFRRIFAEAEQPAPDVFFLSEESGFWNDLQDVFTPERAPSDDPDAWRAGDGVVVFLSDSEGAPLGFASMDEPTSGLRPDAAALRLIRAICAHAETALETARRTESAAENARILSLLLKSSPALAACETSADLLEMAAEIVVPQLGFERFAGYRARDGQLVLQTTRGWAQETAPAPLPTTLAVEQIDALLVPGLEQAGCFLGAAAQLFAADQALGEERSRRNGHGATAWCDHCLVVPCRGTHGELNGLIVIEDPVDRLLPSADRRRAVALLVDQVAAGLIAVDQRERLSHLATHDPLTGVRNRRGLDEVVAAHREVAILVCDLDHFKQVNDRYGHARGDEVLAGFGALLRELARESDVPMRLGGEEFCVILPQTDRDGAVQAAERLRVAAGERLAEFVPGGLTVSIGVAATAHGVLDARGLMSAADRGLYAAKAAGRNRSVLIDVSANPDD
jgi:diguanylate cyclase (GGDEF)-like protein